jgi:hypothetical protein
VPCTVPAPSTCATHALQHELASGKMRSAPHAPLARTPPSSVSSRWYPHIAGCAGGEGEGGGGDSLRGGGGGGGGGGGEGGGTGTPPSPPKATSSGSSPLAVLKGVAGSGWLSRLAADPDDAQSASATTPAASDSARASRMCTHTVAAAENTSACGQRGMEVRSDGSESRVPKFVLYTKKADVWRCVAHAPA